MANIASGQQSTEIMLITYDWRFLPQCGVARQCVLGPTNYTWIWVTAASMVHMRNVNAVSAKLGQAYGSVCE